jgi:hypothetical protein
MTILKALSILEQLTNSNGERSKEIKDSHVVYSGASTKGGRRTQSWQTKATGP